MTRKPPRLATTLPAIALVCSLAFNVNAQTTIVDDDFSDGITNNGALQIGFNTTSSSSALDLGLRTHNVNNDFAASMTSGRFLSTTAGFDFISGGTDDVISFLPNTDYVGSLAIEFTDATLSTLEVTVGIADVAGTFVDTHTDTLLIADNPGVEVG